MTTEREKVRFSTNVPTLVTLERDPPSEAHPGKFGPQFMYWVNGNQTLWADPPVHEQILASAARAGDQFAICKQEYRDGSHRHVRWEVNRVADFPRQAPRAAAPAIAPATRAQTPMFPDPPAHASARAPHQVNAENPMAAALREALEACQLAGFTARPEDVIALAIAIYNRQQQRS